MKYIRTKELGIVIFDNSINHNHMAKLLGEEPISAGHVSVADESYISAYGDSYSLRLSALPEDNIRIKNMARK